MLLREQGSFGSMALNSAGGLLIVRQEPSLSELQIEWYDLASGSRVRSLKVQSRWLDPLQLSHDGGTLLAGEQIKNYPSLFATLATRVGMRWPRTNPAEIIRGRLFDAVTGDEHGEIFAEMPTYENAFWYRNDEHEVTGEWSPDGRTLGVLSGSEDSVVQLWDIPPRKPLVWFAAGVALLAIPIAWLARRRMRKLRAAAV